jgi:Beta-lactamase class C and other penicillin binding proteins
MASYKVQGVSIAVINNYEIEWVKAYGWADAEERRPATTQTLFQAASVSKSLNAIGILNWLKTKKSI